MSASPALKSVAGPRSLTWFCRFQFTTHCVDLLCSLPDLGAVMVEHPCPQISKRLSTPVDKTWTTQSLECIEAVRENFAQRTLHRFRFDMHAHSGVYLWSKEPLLCQECKRNC